MPCMMWILFLKRVVREVQQFDILQLKQCALLRAGEGYLIEDGKELAK